MNEQFKIVYFTTATNNSVTHFQTQLNDLTECVEVFNNVDECVNFLTDCSSRKIIFVADASDVNPLIISILNELCQLISIYLYDESGLTKETTGAQDECQNVKFITNTYDELYKKLSYDLITYERQQDSIRFDTYMSNGRTDTSTSVLSASVLPVFHRTDESTSDLCIENGNFIWFQLFIEVLLRMKDEYEEQKKELIDYCEKRYNGNGVVLRDISDFKTNYSSDFAVRWYTRNTCLFKLLNEALRKRDAELLVKFSFFIADMHKQLSDIGLSTYDADHFQVYRGQFISRKEFSRLKKSIGDFISFNSFLSTSKNPNVATIFAGQSTDEYIAVKIEIDVDRHIKDTKAYANISSLSNMPDEEEILFMLGSVFRILNIKDGIDNELPTISLELCSEQDQMYKDVFKHEQLKFTEYTTSFQLADLLFRIGDYSLSEKYYKKFMQNYPEFSPLCQGNLALISYQKYPRPIDIERHEQLVDSIHKMITDHGITNDELVQVTAHIHKGFIYQYEALQHAVNGTYDLALLSQQKALDQQLQCSVPHLPSIATSYFNIGQYHYMLNNFLEACEYFKKALSIREKSLPGTHRDLSATYFVLGCYYEEQKDYHLALEYYTKALDIRRHSIDSTPIELWMCDQCIKRVNNYLLK